MKFEMPSLLYEKYFLQELESYKILMDTEEKLLIQDSSYSFDSVGHSILYEKLPQSAWKRSEIVFDVSDHFDFSLQEQVFEVFDSQFGLVESERGIYFATYLENSLQDLKIECPAENMFSIYAMLRKQRKPDLLEVKGYFRESGMYGVDSVFRNDGEKFTISSSNPSLDSVIKTNPFSKC